MSKSPHRPEWKITIIKKYFQEKDHMKFWELKGFPMGKSLT